MINSNPSPALRMGRTYNFFTFLREQFSTLHPTTADLTGRTVIVTGSNIGLGKEAARQFLTMHPAKLILAVRSIEKGELLCAFLYFRLLSLCNSLICCRSTRRPRDH